MWGCVFFFCFVFVFSEAGLFCFLIYVDAIISGKTGRACDSSQLKGERRENKGKTSPVLELNWKNWFIHFNAPFESKHSLKKKKKKLGPGDFVFARPTKCHFPMNTALCTWLHLLVHTDRYTRPFPARPCRCSRNSRVGLSGKQTVRGCWESSPGLQIIVRLTKVSEPAPLLPHTRTHTHILYIHTHITLPVHIKGTIEARFKSAYTIGVLMGPCLRCVWAKS